MEYVMGREIRRVHPDWEHPIQSEGRGWGEGPNYKPLFEAEKPFKEMFDDWIFEKDQWLDGKHDDQVRHKDDEDQSSFEPTWRAFYEWHGGPPDPTDYTPYWPEHERTHYQLYETVTEGTPLSPHFATPEELARWLADNNGNAGPGNATMSYEGWLKFIGVGWAPSMVTGPGIGILSGAQAVVAMEDGDENAG